MNWQQIMEQILEINELQQEIIIKLDSPILKEITVRNKKYCNDANFDLRSLNNAVLEHKVTITPYQVIILKKLNELSLNIDSQSIYINLPETEKEAEKYVIELVEKYELANKCLDLIMNIEKLAETEYETNKNFENTEYAKKIKNETKFFQNSWLNFANIPLEIFENLLIKEYKDYINTLSIETKKDLIIETFALSYDKNAFEYFNKEVLIRKIGKTKEYNLQQISALDIVYSKYKTSLILIERMLFSQMSLQELYDEFKIIYETDFFKQKVNKK